MKTSTGSVQSENIFDFHLDKQSCSQKISEKDKSPHRSRELQLGNGEMRCLEYRLCEVIFGRHLEGLSLISKYSTFMGPKAT